MRYEYRSTDLIIVMLGFLIGFVVMAYFVERLV